MGLLEDRYPAFKFENVGDTFEGVVLSVTEIEDREPDGTAKTWPNGQPKKVWVLNVEPADGDTRAVFVRGNMVKAVREAAVAAKVKELEGATIKVRFSALGEKKPGLNQAKLFQVRLTPGVAKPANSLVGGVDDPEDPF
jgi:hypothetical protein